jgi:hypothetical protein
MRLFLLIVDVHCCKPPFVSTNDRSAHPAPAIADLHESQYCKSIPAIKKKGQTAEYLVSDPFYSRGIQRRHS